MELVLTIIAAPAQSNLLGQSQSFAASGATLGRAADNSWVLPDNERVVSSRHATLAFQNGQYLLIDHSTNGTFINGASTPLGQGNSVVINNGDVLAMGPFQLQAILRAAVATPAQNLGASFLDDLDFGGQRPVAAAAPMAPAAPNAGSFNDLDQWLEPMAPAAQPSHAAWGTTPADVSFGGGAAMGSGNPMPMVESHPETDPLALLGGGNNNDWLNTPAQGGDDDWWQDTQPDNAPIEQHAMRIPEVRPAAPDAVNIDDLLGLAPEAPVFTPPPAPIPAAPSPDITAPNTVRPMQQTAPASPPPTPAAHVSTAAASTAAPSGGATAPDLARALATRLGLTQLPDAQLENLVDEVAAVLRETTARLLDILRARSSIKNELRLERTMIGALENNPLKFSARAEDALAYMFEDRGGAFLRAEAAIRDSFDDLSEHQVAVLAGMREAYNTMLAHFDPAQMEQRFGSGGGGLLANRKARNWEAYQEYYARLAADAESTYSRLFGETFARAYESQIDELKSARRFNPTR